MKVRCVRPHGYAVPGDVAEVPDGAAVSPEYWEIIPEPATASVAPAETPKES